MHDPAFGWILCLTRLRLLGVDGRWVLKSLRLIIKGWALLDLFMFEDWE